MTADPRMVAANDAIDGAIAAAQSAEFNAEHGAMIKIHKESADALRDVRLLLDGLVDQRDAAVDEARKAGERIAALEELLARCAYMIASVTVTMPAWDAKPLYEKVRAILGWPAP